MGVPGFFAWVKKKHEWLQRKQKLTDEEKAELENINALIRGFIDEDVDVLYLDANCLFHPQCFKTLDQFPDWKELDKIQNKMFKRITAFIDFLHDYVDPEVMFISVDGVAPMAKMNQQRKRRYRSKDDNELKNSIKSKHGKSIGNAWSNTVITPGTVFMEQLHKRILQYIKKKDAKIIYSSYHTPGEGEHKILQDIKERSRSSDNEDETYVVYGLDADLIFLASACQKSNIYLLREAQHFGKPVELDEMLKGDFFEDIYEELNYVCIDTMKRFVNEIIIDTLDNKNMDDAEKSKNEKSVSQYAGEDFNDDFIFICYLLGNDFLPHLPSVDIKTGGLDFLINCYTDIFEMTNTHIILRNEGGIEINDVFLDLLFKEISKYEDYYFSKKLPKHLDNWSRRRCPFSDPYQAEIWELENMKCFEVEDPIKLGEDDPELYKFRYYEHYFGVKDDQKNLIKQMAREYVKGIVWVAKYYFEKCPSWEWQYPYSHAPFITDISETFSEINTVDFTFPKTKALNPCTQLLSVLPPACSNLLPLNYRQLLISDHSEVIDMYPTSINLDMINKCMYYQCIPHIPCVDIKRIKNAISKLKLTKDEKIRNTTLKNFSNF